MFICKNKPTDLWVTFFVKCRQRKKKRINSIRATAFMTTWEPPNSVRNLKSWKNKLEEVLRLPEKEVSSSRLFPYCMIVKAPLFWALLLLSELKCWILVCAPPRRGRALQKLDKGLYEVQSNCFFTQPTFLKWKIRIRNAVFCWSLFGKRVEAMHRFTKLWKSELSSKHTSCGPGLSDLWDRDKCFAKYL